MDPRGLCEVVWTKNLRTCLDNNVKIYGRRGQSASARRVSAPSDYDVVTPDSESDGDTMRVVGQDVYYASRLHGPRPVPTVGRGSETGRVRAAVPTGVMRSAYLVWRDGEEIG